MVEERHGNALIKNPTKLELEIKQIMQQVLLVISLVIFSKKINKIVNCVRIHFMLGSWFMKKEIDKRAIRQNILELISYKKTYIEYMKVYRKILSS